MMGESYTVKPDGKHYSAKGNFDNVSLRSPGERTIEVTFFSKGKPIEIDTITLSADGQSFQEMDRDAANNETTETLIYRKQP